MAGGERSELDRLVDLWKEMRSTVGTEMVDKTGLFPEGGFSVKGKRVGLFFQHFRNAPPPNDFDLIRPGDIDHDRGLAAVTIAWNGQKQERVKSSLITVNFEVRQDLVIKRPDPHSLITKLFVTEIPLSVEPDDEDSRVLSYPNLVQPPTYYLGLPNTEGFLWRPRDEKVSGAVISEAEGYVAKIKNFLVSRDLMGR